MNFLEKKINKNNYKSFGFVNFRSFKRYKKDLRLHPHCFNKDFQPSKTSLYSDLGMALHGGKSKRCRTIHLKG